MADTLLLDLPDELLIRCLAGSGGQGIACSAVACTRLHGLQQRLRQLPVFSSAMSTLPSLQHAIRDAGHRALTGCYGAVDFALLFVANYGNARGKKYNDPNDLAHSVDMLREVLGQDPVIVGCACAGLMGVGPDSAPVEVDPQSNTSHGRAAAAEAKRAGRSPPPTKGVSVLLGKLPPGCVARAFAQEVLEGPPAPADPQSPPAGWSWPLLDEAMALTSSQKATLAQQLASLPPTAAQHTAAGDASAAGCDTRPCPPQAEGGAPAAGAGAAASPLHQQPAAQAAAELGASPETAAAAEGLLSVVAAAAAAAATEPANSAPAAGSPADDVVLVPQLCLMLYDTSLQSFGYTESPDMERALTYLAAKGVLVAGGASSGAGDLFFSPGADGRRVTGEPSFTNNPQIVGLMLCTARAPAPAAAPAASTAQAPALPAASPAGPLDMAAVELPTAAAAATGRDDAVAGVSNGSSSKGQTAPPAAAWLDSSASLHTAACAALGLGPSEQGPLFTDVRAKIGYSHALSVNHLAVQLQVDRCSMISPPAQAAPALGQQQDTTAEAAATDAAVDTVSAEAPRAATADGAAAAAAPAGSAAVRRSARLAAAATPGLGDGGSSQSAPVALTPLHHLYAAVTAGAPVAAFDDGDEDDSGQYLAVWVCGPGDKPAAFTGDEAQVAICELLACELESRAGPAVPGSNSNHSGSSHDSSSAYVEITAAVHVSSFTSLRDIFNSAPPGSSLCCQVVGTRGPACAGTIRRCLSQMLPALHQHTPVTASAATAARATAPTSAAGGVGAGRAMADCYDALSRGAVASGARSGLAGVAVCSCTGRGQALYADGAEAPATAFGAVCEAQIVDAVGRAGLPFAGAYVSGELGPEVRHMCSGWFKRDGRTVGVDAAEMQGFTSIFAGWGCQPGVA